MPKTKKNYKKRRTIRKRKSVRNRKSLRGGSGFTEGLRGKTRTMRNTSPERKRTIIPNRFNRTNINYVPIQTNQDLRFIATPPKLTRGEKMFESPPKFRDNGYMIDTQFGPNKSAFYAGPSIIRGEKGIPHGKEGTVVYSTGHVYKGDFNKGKREGTGTFTVKEGPTYEGEWKDDKFVPFIEYKSQNK